MDNKLAIKGFTLIELMVVLLIIGVLMAVATPIFLSARKHAQDNVTKQALLNAAKALSAYYIDAEEFPPRANDSDPGEGRTMEDLEGSFDYTYEDDGKVTPDYSNPPNIAYDPDNVEMRLTSQSGRVWKIDITDGRVGVISKEQDEQ